MVSRLGQLINNTTNNNDDLTDITKMYHDIQKNKTSFRA